MKIHEAIAKQEKPFLSLEFFPPKDPAVWPDFFEVAKKLQALSPLFASVTYGAGGSAQDATLEIAGKLKQMGIEPMPHLTCVGASAEKIMHFTQLMKQHNLENVLALRGDPPANQYFDWSQGEFQYAEDLVKFLRKNAPDLAVGVAGYPAPHPESPSFESDLAFMQSKMRAGGQFIVTQLFFDVREYIEFVRRLRQSGITAPVIPGIVTIQSFEGIKRLLSMCGANIPAKYYLSLEAANASGGVEKVREAGVQFAIQQIKDLLAAGAPGVHLYTLNKADLCTRIAQETGLA